MGAVARGVGSRGGVVHGIIPRALIERERTTEPDPKLYGKTTVVEDMHTRKRLMSELSAAFVAMPGGYGTAEELFEVITWNQLGIHEMPIVIYNVGGFYDGLIAWVNEAVAKGFISPGNRGIIVEAKTAEDVIHQIEKYKVALGRLNLNWDASAPNKHDK